MYGMFQHINAPPDNSPLFVHQRRMTIIFSAATRRHYCFIVDIAVVRQCKRDDGKRGLVRRGGAIAAPAIGTRQQR